MGNKVMPDYNSQNKPTKEVPITSLQHVIDQIEIFRNFLEHIEPEQPTKD